MPDDPTLLEQAFAGHPPDENTEESDPTRTLADTEQLTAKATRIDGEDVPTSDPLTGPTFGDVGDAFSGDKGRPRPRQFWQAKRLGQTPPMELIKTKVTQQLTGGDLTVTAEDGELDGPAAELADLIVDIYEGPHHQKMTFDDLVTAAVSDLLDFAWAYWEVMDSESAEFPVAQFKPLPPLQVQHEVTEGGDFAEDPAAWWVPYKSGAGQIRVDGNAEGLESDRLVVMRGPQLARSDSLYGESLATKVREWLELVIDVTVHQKRHFSDSELPAGFLHFKENADLEEIENDIVEAAGDPHDLVTVDFPADIQWIPVGESVVDLDAIEEQKWFYQLVLAAAGLNIGSLGIVEGSGFAKELPTLEKKVYKEVGKPIKDSIFGPQNNDVVPQIVNGTGVSLNTDLTLGLERFDPVQEEIERQETLDEWREKAVSLNELRGGIGREAVDVEVEIEELGGEVNLADLPRYVVDKFVGQSGGLVIDGEGNVQQEGQGPPDFASDPVMSERDAFAYHGEAYDDRVVRQLEDTIDVQSSFIVSAAYAEETEFMQITFEKTGQNAIYWYGGVPRFRFFNFLRASSKGSYFNKYIRHTGDPGYTYARVQ